MAIYDQTPQTSNDDFIEASSNTNSNANTTNELVKLPLVIAIIITFVTIIYVVLAIFLCKYMLKRTNDKKISYNYKKLLNININKKDGKYYLHKTLPAQSKDLQCDKKNVFLSTPIYKPNARSPSTASKSGSTNNCKIVNESQIKIHQTSENTKRKGNIKYQHNNNKSGSRTRQASNSQTNRKKQSQQNTKGHSNDPYKQFIERGNYGTVI